MALDIQQLSEPSIIMGVDNKDPYSGWKLKNENIYTKVSENITKPKEASDPNCLDNTLESFLRVDKVNTWYAEEKDSNGQLYFEYGVFTNKTIEATQLVIEFYGKFTTWDAYRNLKGKLTKPNFRGLIFPDKGLCVDATKHGNISRYLRRSCTPNAKVVEKWIDGRMRIGIFCLNEKIPIGAEITIPFDYSWGSLRNGLECACSKKQLCPVYIWYNDRKDLSNSFLKFNKIENIKQENVESKPKYDDGVILENHGKDRTSREEVKLSRILKTINKMEEEEKNRRLKSPSSNNQTSKPKITKEKSPAKRNLSLSQQSILSSNNQGTNQRNKSPPKSQNQSANSSNKNNSLTNRKK